MEAFLVNKNDTLRIMATLFRALTDFVETLHGSESPAPFLTDSRQMEGERIRQMAKRLIGPDVAEKQLSNEISAPYEVPQYPIEQIETKLIRYVHTFKYLCDIMFSLLV